MTPRMLVADDDDAARETLAELLTELGFEVLGTPADGADPVRLAVTHEPDVVLMDIRVPRMDGIQATRRIKARTPAVQVIILSAYDETRAQGGSGAGRDLLLPPQGLPTGADCGDGEASGDPLTRARPGPAPTPGNDGRLRPAPPIRSACRALSVG